MATTLEQRVAALESAEKRKANWSWGVAAVVTAVGVFLLGFSQYARLLDDFHSSEVRSVGTGRGFAAHALTDRG